MALMWPLCTLHKDAFNLRVHMVSFLLFDQTYLKVEVKSNLTDFNMSKIEYIGSTLNPHIFRWAI